jgi:hypothetical protein
MAHASFQCEDDVQEPRHRLGGVQAPFQRSFVAVVLESAIGKVEPAVEPVMLDENRPDGSLATSNSATPAQVRSATSRPVSAYNSRTAPTRIDNGR